jgi:hydroxymethylpyrimidine pyrophosphatase-like HAD family hydrolase
MYKLIALDLDETLLGRDGLICPEHKSAIAAARAAGCDVTLVTARSWRATRPFVAELGLTAPVICLTGSAVYSPEGEPLQQQGLVPGEIRRLAAQADEQGWSIRLYYADGSIVHSCPAADFAPKQGAIFPVDQYVGPVSPWLDRRETPLQAALLGHRSVEGALALLAELPGMAATTYERFGPAVRTHLMHASVTKGGALAEYCQERSIPREAVIAMGDSEPDRSMIAWAGTGVAMGWAPETVRLAADLVIDEAEPAPVAAAIRSVLGV